MSADFAHLHVASGFSLRHGTTTPEDLVARAAELGQPALALTDRDGLYGAPGQSFEITTQAGTAEAVVFPLGPDQGLPLQRLVDGFFALIFDWAGRNVFVYRPLTV